MIVLGLVGGAFGAVALWMALRPVFAARVLERRNYRNVAVPTGGGLVIAVVAIAYVGVVAIVQAGGAHLDPAAVASQRGAVIVAVGFGLLGFVDDLVGIGESGGFRGHIAALAHGRLTTGGLKLFGGGALAIVVVSSVKGDSNVGRLLADAALVALSANLGNLFDRAPGRLTKVAFLVFVVLLVATGADAAVAGPAILVGAGVGLAVPDLREQLMLGDAGSNVLGAGIALGAVMACSPGVRVVLLVVVAALNVASEVVSFSRVIDRLAPLRAIDRMGRAA